MVDGFNQLKLPSSHDKSYTHFWVIDPVSYYYSKKWVGGWEEFLISAFCRP